MAELISSTIKELENLKQRLILDYNGDKPFEQFEEDRLVVDAAIELLTAK